MRLPALRSAFSYTPELTIWAVLIVALFVRIWGLGDASLWIDESFTVITSSLPMSTLWITPYDPTPPLFFTVEKFILLFGDDEFLIRLPSVIFNVATVYIMYRAARLEVGFKGALPVAIILALSTPNLEYAQEARAYSLLGLMISLAFLGLVQLNQFITENDKKVSMSAFLTNGGLLYAIATLGSLYTHNISVFFVFGVQVYFASLFVLKRKRFVELIKYWLIINVIIFVCWIPWLNAAIEVSKTGTFSWLEHESIRSALYSLRFIHGLPFVSIGQPFVDFIVASGILAGLYFLRKKPMTFALVFSLLISSSLIIWLFGYIKPVFMARTILWGSLFSAFLLGIVISRMKAPMYVLALTTIIVLGLRSVSDYREQNHTENENWRDTVSFVQDNANPSEPVLLCADFVKDAFSYYSNSALFAYDHIYGWSTGSQMLRSGSISTLESSRPNIVWKGAAVGIDALQAENRLWIIRSHCIDSEVAKLFERANELGLEETQHRQFKRIDVWVFARDGE